MKNYLYTFGILLAVVGNVQASEITETSVIGTRFKFTAKLDVPLIAGNKVKIEFGKNLVPMTCVETTCTLFRTINSDVMPTYKIGIYNSKNVLQSTNLESNSTTNLPVYTKIANDGSELPDSAKLGSNPKDWACTKDNKTGLIWEVKTDDSSMRDKDEFYSLDNSGKLVTALNTINLCGASNWRMPTLLELEGIIKLDNSKPAINTTYFPNTVSYLFWSAGTTLSHSALVDFDTGGIGGNNEAIPYAVRLVRDTQ